MKFQSLAVKLLATVMFSLTVCVTSGLAQTFNVTVAWNAPTTNADGTPISGLTSYRLKRSLVSGNFSNAVITQLPASALQLNVTGLSYNTTHYFVVTAVNNQGLESVPSNQIQVRINQATPTPTPTATPTLQPTPIPTATPSPTPQPTPIPTATPSPTPEPTPTPTPTPKSKGKSYPGFKGKGGNKADSFFKNGSSYVVELSEEEIQPRSAVARRFEQATKIASLRNGRLVISRRIPGAVAIELSQEGDRIEYAKRQGATYSFHSLDPLTQSVRNLGTLGAVRGQKPVVGCGTPVVYGLNNRRQHVLQFSGRQLPLAKGVIRVVCNRADSEEFQFLTLSKRGSQHHIQLVGQGDKVVSLPKAIRNIHLFRVPPAGGAEGVFSVLYRKGKVFHKVDVSHGGELLNEVAIDKAKGSPALIGYEDDSGYFGLFYRSKRFAKFDLEENLQEQ